MPGSNTCRASRTSTCDEHGRLARHVEGGRVGRVHVFHVTKATTMTGTRNKLEYLDVEGTQEVSEDDARWAAQIAELAVADVSSFLT